MNAQQLKDLRKRIGLKQYEMAKTLGISRSTYMRYELGHSPIKEPVSKLAEVIREQSIPPS